LGDKFSSYTAQSRADAAALEKEIVSGDCAKQLDTPSDTLHTWTKRAKSKSLPLSQINQDPKVSLNLAEQITVLEEEINACKKEHEALLKELQLLKDTFFFSQNSKRSRKEITI